MKERTLASASSALSVLRIVAGLMIIEPGMSKIIGFPAMPAYATVQPLSLMGATGFLELIGGALLILGLLTRPAAFILAGEMAFAYFSGHAPKSFNPLNNGGTLAIMYCFTCLYLSFAGAGPWSLDAAMKRTRGLTMDRTNKLFVVWESRVLSIFRIITGLLLFQYGVAKLFKFPPVPMFEKVEVMSLFGIAAIFELIFGGLLILGRFSRLAAFILCGEMACAYFIGHFPRGLIPLLNNGSLAVMFCFGYLYLAFAGGGPWSLDAIIRKKT